MICTAEGCTRKLAAKGYCHMHYNRWRRHGDPAVRKTSVHRGLSLIEHINALRDQSGGPLSCWNFTQVPEGLGYGHFMHGGVVKMAHVWAYELENGPPPRGLVVRHSCDNRLCMNPGHLLVGTHQQNMDDKVQRDRQARMPGESNPRAKLTEDQVLFIREAVASGERTRRELAEEFEVSKSAIEFIVTGKRWAHLLPEIGVAA